MNDQTVDPITYTPHTGLTGAAGGELELESLSLSLFLLSSFYALNWHCWFREKKNEAKFKLETPKKEERKE